jgi:hypothetical protein
MGRLKCIFSLLYPTVFVTVEEPAELVERRLATIGCIVKNAALNDSYADCIVLNPTL